MNLNEARSRAALVLLLAATAATHAANITWNNPAGGDWNTAANWSPAQVPGAADTAIINFAGNYVVTARGSISVTNLVVGGAGSTPTLRVLGANTSGNATLTVANGFVNNGTIELTTTNSNWSSTFNVTVGTLTNAVGATIRCLAGTLGNRTLSAALDNRGSLVIEYPLAINKANVTHRHSGSLTVNAGQTLTYSGGGVTFNHAGGSFSGTGTVTFSSITVALQTDLTVTETTLQFPNTTVNGVGKLIIPATRALTLQTTTVNAPVEIAGQVIVLGTTAMNGAVTTASTGLLRVLGANTTGNGTLTVANGFVNNGTIELTTTNSNWSSTFNVTAGTLTNAVGATIRCLAGALGNRTLAAALDNRGSLVIEYPLAINKANVTHRHSGSLTVNAGQTLTYSGSGVTFNHAGGSFSGTGTVTFSSITVALQTDLTVTETTLQFPNTTVNGVGKLIIPATRALTLQTTTVNAPVEIAGQVIVLGTTAMNGAVTTASTGLLRVLGANTTGNGTLTVANGFVNNGTIELTTTNSNWSSTFNVTTGTLTNAVGATIRCLAGALGNRTLAAALDNRGSLVIEYPLAINKANVTHRHSGSLTVNAGQTLTYSGGGMTFNYAGGTLSGAGTVTFSSITVVLQVDLTVTETTLQFPNTTVNGVGKLIIPATRALTLQTTTVNAPVEIAGQMIVLGTTAMNGAVTTASTGLLRVLGANTTGNGTLTVANGFVNNGTIELTTTNSNWSSTFNVTTGTLTNAVGATIRCLADALGNRTLAAALDNRGSLVIEYPLAINKANVTHSHSGSLTVNAGQTLTYSGSGVTFNYAGGTLSGVGTVTFSSITVVLQVDLTVTETTLQFPNTTVNGVGKLIIPATRALTLQTTTVNAPVEIAGQMIVLGTTAMNGAVTTASTGLLRVLGANTTGNGTLTVANGFVNNGTIELTTTNSNWSATFNVTAGSLTNAAGATLRSLLGTAGFRTLAAAFNNLGSIIVELSLTVSKAGGTYTNNGIITINAAQTLTFAQGTFENAVNGTVNGTGTLDVSAGGLVFNNNGAFAPGTSAGILNVRGRLPHGASAKLKVEVGGPTVGMDYDRLTVTGTENLGGNLEVMLLNGFQPAGTDTFTVSQANAITNTFANVANGGRLATMDGGGSFQVNFGPGSPFGSSNVVLNSFVPSGTPQNQPPVVMLPGGPLNYMEGAGAVLLDPLANVADSDSANFDTGTMRIEFTANGASEDRLSIRNEGNGPGQIGVSGNTVSIGGVNIGTFTGGQNGSTPLMVTFNANATPNAAQALLRNLTYQNVSSTPSTLPRTVRVVVADGDGGTSTAVLKTINVISVKENPVLAWLPRSSFPYGTRLGPPELNAMATAQGANLPGTYAYSPTANTLLNAGLHILSVTFTPDNTANYNTVMGMVQITVLKADQTNTFAALTNTVYGVPPFPVFASASSGLPMIFSIISGPATIVGNIVTISGAGVVAVRASQPGNANYNPAADADQTFTVARAPLTITADNKMRGVGQPDPQFTASYMGFVNNEEPASLDNPVTFTTTATPNSPAGMYPIIPSGGQAANYTNTFVNGTLTVATVSPAVISVSNTVTIIYGTPLTLALLNPTANTSGTFTISPTNGTVPNAGNGQAVTVTFTPNDTNNFSPATTIVSMNVLRALLTIRANDTNAPEGTAAFPLTATFTGLVNNDTPASLDTPLTLSTTANAGSPPGMYPIIPSGAADPNYNITNISGTLTITGAGLVSISITPGTPFLAAGQSQQLSAWGTYSDGTMQNLTGSVMWTSDNTNVATIGSAGLVNARAIGNAVIKASLAGIIGSTRVIVTVLSEGMMFNNPAPILASNGSASPYPSTIDVSGLVGTVADLNVTLNLFSHTWPADIDIVLVSPTGQKVVLMSDAGSSFDVTNAVMVLDDAAMESLPETSQLVTGTYRPTNYDLASDVFPPPAPDGPYAGALAEFIGHGPNGAWSLYVVDDSLPDAGAIAGGWSLTIRTVTNALPAISDIPSQITRVNATTPPIPFTVGDAETPANNLIVFAASSNPLLLPNANIALSGSGANRTLTLTPAPGQAGMVEIQVTVTDALGASASDPFELTVEAQEPPKETTTTVRFSNPGMIRIPIVGPATPYPSVINVSGLYGHVTRTRVTLHQFSHPWPDDVDALLVGPTGQKVLFLSDAGGRWRVNNSTLTFCDAAVAALSNNGQISAGTYKPSNYFSAPDVFPASAPPGPYPSTLSVFNGINPNGEWKLYLVDDSIFFGGTIAGGWSLEITTQGLVTPPPGLPPEDADGRITAQSHNDNDGDADEATEEMFKELSANKRLMTLESITALPNQTLRLSLFGQAGQRYILQSTRDFTAWQNLSTNVAPKDLFQVEDATAAPATHRFYRALILP